MNRKLNIGCGPYPARGYYNIDMNPKMPVDQVVDVRDGLPFKDNEFFEVLASHFLEHLWSPEVIALIEEVYRVLRPKGRFVIIVPLMEICELDHLTMFNERSFDELTRPDRAVYHNRTWAWSLQNKKLWSDTQRTDRPPLPCMKVILIAAK